MKTSVVALLVIGLTASTLSAQAVYTPPETPAATEPAAPAPAAQETQAPAAQETQAPAAQETQTPAIQEAPAPVAAVRTVQVELQRISKLLYGKDFKAAKKELTLLNREFRNDPDINNLLGFTNRKLKLYTSSAFFYRTALKLNPNHLDALAYQGELFIVTKKMPLAKKNLAKLKTLCGVSCSQYQELKSAIAKA